MGLNSGIPTKFNVANEYGKLKSVMMALFPAKIREHPQFRKYQALVDAVNAQEGLVKILLNHGVEVKAYPIASNIKLSDIYARDPNFVIGDKMYMSGLGEIGDREKTRDAMGSKFLGIKNPVDSMKILPYFESKKDGIIIEGGDILVDIDASNTIYVGQNMRTNDYGLEHMKKMFGDKHNVVPIYVKDNVEAEAAAHLDCVMNILSGTEVVACTELIEEKSLQVLQDRYNILDVTRQEQFNLATNVLNLGNRTVVSQPNQERVNGKLAKMGFAVQMVDLGSATIGGGAFRCMTCPMERENV